MKKQISLILIITLFSGVSIADAQSGGAFTITPTVIAGGGGESSGGSFKIEGTIGQAVAGTNSTNSPFSVRGGFWMPQALSPTAASVSISGRIFNPRGRGLRNARVTLTASGGSTRTVLSGTFGYYSFDEVAAGETYIITVVSKRYQFTPQVLTITEELDNIEFTALSFESF